MDNVIQFPEQVPLLDRFEKAATLLEEFKNGETDSFIIFSFDPEGEAKVFHGGDLDVYDTYRTLNYFQELILSSVFEGIEKE
jgi:hypothetical protein